MNFLTDEGFTDEFQDSFYHLATRPSFPQRDHELLAALTSVQECEELAFKLLASLPRSRLATIQRRIAPLLQFDVVGSLPAEVSLQIFSHLSFQTLLTCALVSHRWQALANDQSLWKDLCNARGWTWRQPSRVHGFQSISHRVGESWEDSDDEGMGDSDEEDGALYVDEVEQAKVALTQMHAELDSGFASMSITGALQLTNISFASSSNSPTSDTFYSSSSSHNGIARSNTSRARHSAPSILKSLGPSSFLKPNYKLLHQTHIRLHNRLLSSSYRLSALQTRGGPTNAHTNTIYCLQLYTYPSGMQVLFTGSRDRTIREWNLSTGLVERVIGGVHDSSVLSICVYKGFIASAGSDRKVAVWDLTANKLVKVICDHEDSVLCVRFDDERLVSCSKDRTVRTYSFPDLIPQFVLGAHRAAVNAVSISQTLIVSGSGDRSIRLWDANTGKLLHTFENHHSRGIASIDFKPPYVLSGSSDKHLRLFDMTNLQGWSTSPDNQYERNPPVIAPFPFSFPSLSSNMSTVVCQSCGSTNVHPVSHPTGGTDEGAGSDEGVGSHAGVTRCVHGDLVRSVAFGEDFVLSGSYDLSIKVWDRKTGALVADLTGGHTGRIFCIGFDCTKIVSCGEDQRICIWDFSHGIDTSFIQL